MSVESLSSRTPDDVRKENVHTHLVPASQPASEPASQPATQEAGQDAGCVALLNSSASGALEGRAGGWGFWLAAPRIPGLLQQSGRLIM